MVFVAVAVGVQIMLNEERKDFFFGFNIGRSDGALVWVDGILKITANLSE